MADQATGIVVRLQTGTPRPFGPKAVPSAIHRTPVAGRVMAGPLGLTGDRVGDPLRHGGADKAIHAYSQAHYADWRRDLPKSAAHFAEGAFGENLTLAGLVEADICIGDVFTLGPARLQVSQARQPCWKLNIRFGQADMSRLVQDSGRTGWYFRVLAAGEVGAGDVLSRIARPNPDWPLDRVWRLLYRDPPAEAPLREFAGLAGLSLSWQALARRRLENRAVEDWTTRLRGEPG